MIYFSVWARKYHVTKPSCVPLGLVWVRQRSFLCLCAHWLTLGFHAHCMSLSQGIVSWSEGAWRPIAGGSACVIPQMMKGEGDCNCVCVLFVDGSLLGIKWVCVLFGHSKPNASCSWLAEAYIVDEIIGHQAGCRNDMKNTCANNSRTTAWLLALSCATHSPGWFQASE